MREVYRAITINILSPLSTWDYKNNYKNMEIELKGVYPKYECKCRGEYVCHGCYKVADINEVIEEITKADNINQ